MLRAANCTTRAERRDLPGSSGISWDLSHPARDDILRRLATTNLPWRVISRVSGFGMSLCPRTISSGAYGDPKHDADRMQTCFPVSRLHGIGRLTCVFSNPAASPGVSRAPTFCACQRRSDSRPVWRCKSRPLVARHGCLQKGPRSGAFLQSDLGVGGVRLG